MDAGVANEAANSGSSVKQTQSAIELALFAPYNEVVQLMGSFNDWKPIDMNKGNDGWWRANVELPDGLHLYRYRVKSLSYFALGEMLDVFDPYAVSVTDEANEAAILRVEKGKRVFVDYTWRHDDVPLPDNRDLVIYELHVGDFSGGKGDKGRGKEREKGQLKHVVEKMDYLRDLGINCIELMPVKEFPGKGWGYSLRSLFAVDNGYGTPEDLCRLVDEAHARGIRVIIDGVYNHAEAEAPLAKIAYEYWFYRENPDPPEMQWGPKFNYAHFDKTHNVFPARKYVIDSIRYWVEKFHIDGIRFDATRAIRDFDVMRELTDAAFERIDGRKPFICISEHVPEDPAITGRPAEGPMNANWHDSLGRCLQAIITNQTRDGNDPYNLDELEHKINLSVNGYKQADRVVNFITNHDFAREMRILAEDAHLFDDCAFRRCKLGQALLMTIPGIPMIWMGTEFGFSAEKTLDPRPLDWTLLANDRNRDLHAYTTKLVHLRREIDALRADSFQVLLKDGNRHLFAFKRWNDGGSQAVIVANLQDKPSEQFTIEKAGLEDGMWRDAVHGGELKIENGILHDTLGPSEVKIYVKK
jgi:1,4-alpha-glucan branching enzyme